MIDKVPRLFDSDRMFERQLNVADICAYLWGQSENENKIKIKIMSRSLVVLETEVLL